MLLREPRERTRIEAEATGKLRESGFLVTQAVRSGLGIGWL